MVLVLEKDKSSEIECIWGDYMDENLYDKVYL